MSRDLTHLRGASRRGWLRTTDGRRRFTPRLIRVLWVPDPSGELIGRAVLNEPTDVFEGLELWHLVPDWPLPVRVRFQTPLRASPPGWLIHLVPEEVP